MWFGQTLAAPRQADKRSKVLRRGAGFRLPCNLLESVLP